MVGVGRHARLALGRGILRVEGLGLGEVCVVRVGVRVVVLAAVVRAALVGVAGLIVVVVTRRGVAIFGVRMHIVVVVRVKALARLLTLGRGVRVVIVIAGAELLARSFM